MPHGSGGVIPVPMVFISHSSREDSYATNVCEAVQREIKKRSWDFFVDTCSFKGGEEWQGDLYHRLAGCEAAVILVNRKALESPWVRRESDILLWRKALGSPVTIIPAMLGDVTDADVKGSDLSELMRIEFVKQDQAALDQAEAERLARAIVTLLPDLSKYPVDANEPMRGWLRNIVACLKSVEDREILQAAARALAEADDWTFTSAREGQLYLAHQLLGNLPQGQINAAVEEIAYACDKLKGLIKLVAPVWVNPRAARPLLPDGGQVVAILGATKSEIARQYVQRASCCSVRFRVATAALVAGEDQRGEFLRACDEGVKKLLDLKSSDSLDGTLSPLKGQVGFLVIDPNDGPMDVVMQTLPGLLARFPWLNVIVLAEESALALAELAGTPLRPGLGSGDEQLAIRNVNRLNALLTDVGAE